MFLLYYSSKAFSSYHDSCFHLVLLFHCTNLYRSSTSMHKQKEMLTQLFPLKQEYFKNWGSSLTHVHQHFCKFRLLLFQNNHLFLADSHKNFILNFDSVGELYSFCSMVAIYPLLLQIEAQSEEI